MAKTSYATIKDLRAAAIKRGLFSDKLANGKILVVAGSSDYHGAAVLASNSAYALLAAMRTGAGYAVAYVPKSVVNVVRSLSPNIIVHTLQHRNICNRDFGIIKSALPHYGVLIIGNGIGKGKEQESLVRKVIDLSVKTQKKTVIDADAIFALKDGSKLGPNSVVTPNEKEAKFLCKKEFSYINNKERISVALQIAKNFSTNVLLKGHETIVTDGTNVKIIQSHSAALAVMGTGDVLSGMIGAYAANNKSMFKSTVAAAYLHSLIGDLLYAEKGNHILATDIIDAIPTALKLNNL